MNNNIKCMALLLTAMTIPLILFLINEFDIFEFSHVLSTGVLLMFEILILLIVMPITYLYIKFPKPALISIFIGSFILWPFVLVISNFSLVAITDSELVIRFLNLPKLFFLATIIGGISGLLSYLAFRASK